MVPVGEAPSIVAVHTEGEPMLTVAGEQLTPTEAAAFEADSVKLVELLRLFESPP